MFSTILMTFVCDIKIDTIICEPHCVKLLLLFYLFYLFIYLFVNLLPSLAILLFNILKSFSQSDIFLTYDLLLKPPQPVTGLFLMTIHNQLSISICLQGRCRIHYSQYGRPYKGAASVSVC